jgi:hypothetical protein
MDTLRTLGLLAFCAALSFDAARGETHGFNVGGTPITIPAPVAFFRCDGKNNEIDQLHRSFVPASNRLLAVFGSEDALAQTLTGAFPIMDRSFAAQSSQKFDSLVVSSSAFKTLKAELRPMLQAADRKLFSGVLDEIENKASSVLSSVSQTSMKLKFGETVMLGVFDETPNSFCFSTLTKGQLGDSKFAKPSEAVVISAGCTLHVCSKIIYLYCHSTYREKGDIEWARSNLTKWRDAVIAANPLPVSGPTPINSNSSPRGARSSLIDRSITRGIGGLATGAVFVIITLLVNAFKKRKQ